MTEGEYREDLRQAGIHTSFHGLLDRLQDSIEVFSTLATRSHVPAHRDFAERHIVRRREFARQISASSAQGGSNPDASTRSSTLRRIQTRVRMLLPHSERKMLDSADQIETSLRAAYLRLLQDNPRSPDLRELLQRQQAEVGKAQSELTSLRRRHAD